MLPSETIVGSVGICMPYKGAMAMPGDIYGLQLFTCSSRRTFSNTELSRIRSSLGDSFSATRLAAYSIDSVETSRPGIATWLAGVQRKKPRDGGLPDALILLTHD
jgi:hypothetical protein